MQPTRPRRPRFRAALASLVFAFALTTCDQPAAGPGGRAALAVQVVMPTSPDLALFNLTIDNVRLIVVRPPSDTVFNQVFFFPPDQTDLPLEADIPMQTSPETFRVTIELLSGTQVLFSGTQDVSLDEGTTNPPAQLPVTYSGPGQNVATLSIGPVDSVLTQGGTLQFRLTAQDGQGAPVPTFYASWTTSDTVIAKVDASGLLTAPFSRSTISVQARTPSNVSVSTPITFVPAPIAINIVSGCGQSGSPGAQLPQPIVARVIAGDGFGVKGVQVQFTAPTGGSVATPLVVTDDNGLAQTLATLPPLGPAAFSIGATGLTSVSCSQTVLGATHLVFGVQPSNIVAGGPITVTVTAMDAFDNPVTSFTGAVNLGLATNPGGITFGTPAVVAVAGVATFSGFTITRAASGYSFLASSGSLTPATSTLFDVVSGAPAQLAFTSVPGNQTVTQGVPITPPRQVVIQDAFGNSATTATDNVTIDIGANPGGSVLGGTPTQAAIAGVAAFPDLTLNEVGTGYTLIATSGNLTPATSAPFNVVAVTGLHLVFTTQPSNVTAGTFIAPAVVVTAQDAQNNPVPSFTGDVTLGFGSCAVGAILSGTTTVTAVSGNATFADLGIDRAGGCILVATSSGLQNVASGSFTVSPGAPAQVAFTIQPSTVAVGVVMTPIVRVTIEDALGNPVVTATNDVTLAIGANPGGAVLSGTLTKTAASGVALFTDLTLDQAGTGYTLVATSGTLTSAASTTFDVTAGAVTQLAVVVTPPSVTAGTPATIVVAAQDGSGATVTGYLGTVHFTSTDQQATLPLDYTFTTGDNGVHIFTGGATLGTQGAQAVTATDVLTSSITGTGSVSVTAGAATVLAFTVQPTAIDAGANFTPPLLVTARDAFGNTATSFAGTVSLAIGTNPGGAVLLGTATVSAAAGVASFASVSLDKVGTGYTLVAASVSLNSAPSATFNVTAGAATQLAFLVQPSTVTQGGAIAPAVQVAIQDQFGNTVPTATDLVTMTIGANPGSATLGGAGPITPSAGIATFSNLSLSAPGAGYTLVATASALGTVESSPFGVLPVAAGIAWNNPAGGNWSVPGNWSPARVPGKTDTVFINLPGTYTVTLDVNDTVAFLTMGGGGSPTLAGSNRTFGVDSLATIGVGAELSLTNGVLNGAGDVTNQGTLRLQNTTANAGVQNAGLVIARSSTAFNGTLANAVGATLRVEGDAFCCSTNVTVASGFTNSGAIELTAINATGTTAQLNVTNGTLVNAVGATISSLAGNGGTRTLAAQLDNRGTLTVAQPLTLTKPSAVHANSGTIALAAHLTISQSGTTPSFTTSGTITVALGDTLFVISGAFNYNGGAIGGLGALLFTSGTLALTPSLTNDTLGLSFTNAIVNGPGTLGNAPGATLVAQNTTFNGPVNNQGLFRARSSTDFNGTLTNAFGATLRVEGDAFCCSTNVTVATGFTNSGAIELTAINATGTTAQLNVTNGPLVNAVGATISSLVGNGGTRTLAAQLDNRGTLTVAQALTLTKASAVHSNIGTIALAADLTLSQSGTTPSFAITAGAITIAAGDTLFVSGGTFTYGGGAIGGLGALVFTSGTLTLTPSLTNDTLGLSFTNAIVNGPGMLGNAPGATLVAQNTTFNGPVNNQGLFRARSSTDFNGTLTNAFGATLRVEGDAFCCSTNVTVATGFMNSGAIELTAINATGTTAQLNVTNGPLVNAVGATISSLAGNGGARTLNAVLTNQGTLTVVQALTMNHVSAVHSNSGTINVAGGDLTITQSGTTPSFTNTGTIAVLAGDTLTISGGAFTQNAGSLGGAGALELSSVNPAAFNTGHSFAAIRLSSTTASFSTSQSTGATAFTLTNSTVNGPGTFTNLSGQTLVMTNGVMNAALDNQGLLLLRGSPDINGTFTTGPGSTLRVEGDAFCCSATATVLNGFINNGTIILTAINATGTTAQLTVTNGTLVNASTRLIDIQAGNGGARTLNAALNNQGTLTINHPLTMSRASSVHSNGGTINVTGGDFTINQSGITPSFTNTGTINVPTGRTWTISGGAWTHGGPTLGGATQATGGALVLGSVNPAAFNTTHTLSSITLNSTVASFALDQTTATAFSLNNATVNGPGKFTNLLGNTLVMTNGVMNADLANQGLLVLRGSPDLNGALTTTSTSTLRVEGDAFCCSATATVLNGFTNNGTIELTAINATGTTAQLSVTNGTLLNIGTAAINVLTGAGGARTLNAALNNQGTFTINQPLTMGRPSSVHQNSGSMNIASGDLTINQSGTTPSFTNTGTINLPSGRTWTVSGGAWTHSGPTLGSGGALVLGSVNPAAFGTAHTLGTITLNSTVATFTQNQSSASTTFTFTNATVNGPGGFTNAAGKTIVMTNGVMNAAFDNQGLFTLRGSPDVNGAFTTAAGSTLRVEGDAFCCSAAATILDGFTNNGTIELTAINATGTTAGLSVTNGILVNASGRLIHVQAGNGGARHLNAALDNKGTITVSQGLTVNKPDADHVNSGLLQLAGGDMTVTESGTRPGFSNTGTIDVGTNKFVVNGTGSFLNQQGGIMRGSGTFDIAPNISFITNGRTIVDGTPGGRLNWVGTYLQGPNSTLPTTLELNVAGLGANPGTDYDQLNVSDNVTLQGGTLQVTGTLVPGEVYFIIQVPAGKTITGEFQTKTGLGQCASGVSGTVYVIAC